MEYKISMEVAQFHRKSHHACSVTANPPARNICGLSLHVSQ